jgi:hypothetical protein
MSCVVGTTKTSEAYQGEGFLSTRGGYGGISRLTCAIWSSAVGLLALLEIRIAILSLSIRIDGALGIRVRETFE